MKSPNENNESADKSFKRDFEKAISLRNAGRYREAVELFKLLIDLRPKTAAAYYVLGGLYFYNLNDPNSAITYLKEATTLAPLHEWASVTLFHSFNEAGRVDEAWEEMKRFARVRPKSKAYKELLKEINEGLDRAAAIQKRKKKD
jgi:tetratricopeptide (TPR) repeat protein